MAKRITKVKPSKVKKDAVLEAPKKGAPKTSLGRALKELAKNQKLRLGKSKGLAAPMPKHIFTFPTPVPFGSQATLSVTGDAKTASPLTWVSNLVGFEK